MEEFIRDFSDQFDETDLEEFIPSLKFHELEEWSSLVGLAVLNMITKKYHVKLSPLELKDCITIQDLWDLIQEKNK